MQLFTTFGGEIRRRRSFAVSFSMKHKKFLAIPIVVGVVAAYFIFFFPNSSTTRVTATVGRIVDGDTIVLASGDRVRLLGIDAPEKGNYYYNPASERLGELIEGKTVVLESDVTSSDNFGRLLRYVFVDGEFVNLKMVEEGYAFAYVVAPNEKYMNELVEAEERAREKQLVIWESSVNSNCIEAKINYNAKGDDTENLNGEYIVFKNKCDYEIDMTDWLAKDEQANNYTFPTFALLSGYTVTLYSGSGTDTGLQLYWDSDKPIWNNDGDTLFLRDGEGKLIIKQSYGEH